MAPRLSPASWGMDHHRRPTRRSSRAKTKSRLPASKKVETKNKYGGYVYIYIYIYMVIWCLDINGWLDGWMDGWMGGRMDGWVGGWLGGWMEWLSTRS